MKLSKDKFMKWEERFKFVWLYESKNKSYEVNKDKNSDQFSFRVNMLTVVDKNKYHDAIVEFFTPSI